MRVLILGTDKSLVGAPALGDAIERHGRYGAFVDSLDIIVYTSRTDNLKKFIISDKVTGYPTNSKSKLRFFFDALKLFHQLNAQYKIDVVVCQDPFVIGLLGCYLKKKYKLKLQINFHGDFWRNFNWLKERWLNIFFLLISKFTVPCADAVRVMSAGQRDKLIQAGIPSSKIKVIATPVNLEKYSQLPVEKHIHQAAEKEKIILHIGRDDKVKDYATLLRAFKIVQSQLPATWLYQVGANQEIKAALKSVGLKDASHLVLKGRRSHDELLRLLSQAQLLVLSSTSESFGKVLVEANAAGKPVVSTATTGAQEIIQDGYNGFLVPVGDAHGLAEQILKLLNNPNLAEKMGRQGRELMQKKYADNTRKIVDLWKELIER